MKTITIQETNDSSILSKASIVNLRYFDDPFLKLFTSKVVRRAPLIHYGYYVRAKSIDYILTRFLSVFTESSKIQIISLGAGFDSAYFRLKNNNQLSNCRYLEIDFEGVVRRKIQIIEKHDSLKRFLGRPENRESVLLSTDYTILSCDLTDVEKLNQLFEEHEVDFDIPTLLISECVLTYVEYEKCRKLFEYFTEHFTKPILSIYEQILPYDGFGKVMLKHFNKIQSPLKRIHKLYNILQHENEMKKTGFEYCVSFDMNWFYQRHISDDEKKRVRDLEVFDEFEEFHLKCKHYVLVTAFKGVEENIINEIFPFKSLVTRTDIKSVDDIPTINISIKNEIELQRFAHACVQLNKNKYLITGGIGVGSHKTHEMLNDAVLLHTDENNQLNKINIRGTIKRVHHTSTKIGDNKFFIYGGRQSPLKPCTELYIGELSEDSELELFCVQKSDIMVPRWRHSASYYKGKVYIFGGRTKDAHALNDLWSFDVSTNTWRQEKLLTEMKGRHSHSMVTYQNQLVIFGGLTYEAEILNECLLINISETTRSRLSVSHIQTGVPLPARYSHSCHVLNDTLIVIGGIDIQSEFDSSIILLSLKTNTWKMCQLFKNEIETPLLLHNHISILLEHCTEGLTATDKGVNGDDGANIIVLGGGGNCFSFGTHFNPNPCLFTIKNCSI